MSDYYPLLFFRESTNDTKGKLGKIKWDFKALGFVFSLILPVRGCDIKKSRWVLQVNN